tara:strand:- start:412 stop:594 length:183 start_codon:yes stop_codon:yes gene_type:complete
MKIETQGWGSSMIATKYVHERLKDIQECVQHVSRSTVESVIQDYLNELELNYEIDTGEKL